MVERLRLTAPALDFWVDATVLAYGNRWMVVAEIGGDREIGLGMSRSDALRDALHSLGHETTEALIRERGA